jgi:transcription initiation factor IIE alpha subunit
MKKNQKLDQATAENLLKESQKFTSVAEILYERKLVSDKELAQITRAYYRIPVSLLPKKI